MFYDPLKEQVIDYVEGQADLARRIIRTIGDPEERFGEDYLRMLRAVRFSTQLGFAIEPETYAADRPQCGEDRPDQRRADRRRAGGNPGPSEPLRAGRRC